MKKVHIAIMRKSWGLTKKILRGEKIIESRWYVNKHKPWGDIHSGDIVYFKDSGEPVKAKAEVDRVIQFDKLTPKKVEEILNMYARDIGLDSADKYFQLFKDKRYCLLVFLNNPREVEPFDINKSGFGAMSAWITVNDLDVIKLQ